MTHALGSNSTDPAAIPQLYYRALGDVSSEFQRVDMVPRMVRCCVHALTGTKSVTRIPILE